MDQVIINNDQSSKRLIILVSLLTSLCVTLVFNLLAYGLPSKAYTPPTTSNPTPPTIMTMSPNFLSVSNQQATITITGANFVANYDILFDGVYLATSTRNSASQLTFRITPTSSREGIHQISLRSSNTQNSNSLPIAIGPYPIISDTRPTTSAPGRVIDLVINGSSFREGCVIAIQNPNTGVVTEVNPATFSSTRLTYRVPANQAILGVYTFAVINPAILGSSRFSSNSFTLTIVNP